MMIPKKKFKRVIEYIEIGKKEGAIVLTGGDRLGKLGYFVKPTVFGDVKPEMRIAQEEIFGPVAALFRFQTEQDAIVLANSTPYGLAAGIHSQGMWWFVIPSFIIPLSLSPPWLLISPSDIQQVHRVSRKLKAGTVWVNQYVILNSQVPFGGEYSLLVTRSDGFSNLGSVSFRVWFYLSNTLFDGLKPFQTKNRLQAIRMGSWIGYEGPRKLFDNQGCTLWVWINDLKIWFCRFFFLLVWSNTHRL